MKTTLQKIGILIAVLLGSLSAYAYDFDVDGIFYTITSTAELTCEVSGSNTDIEELIIPESVTYLNRDLKVTAIGAKAFLGRDIKKVVLPNTVKYLKNDCFRESKIIIIKNTSNVSLFGKYCFRGCEYLKNIEFGQTESVYIRGGSFYKCSALESISIHSNNILDDSDGTYEGYFEECIGLEEATIDCQILPPLSFGNCSSLKTVVFGENCRSLGPSCFVNCSSLKTVVFGENCRSLGTSCFMNCISLVNLTIPSSIIGINSYCFKGCSSLKSVRIPESVNLEEKPSGWTSSEFYGESMFQDCTSLEDVDWNANIIPLYAFEGCTSLNHLTIGGNTNQIYLGSIPCPGGSYKPVYTFDGCNIKNLTILPSDNNLELFFEEVGSNWWEFTNSLYLVTGYQQELLQLFDKVEELYIAREIKPLIYNKADTQYNSLKRLILGDGCSDYFSFGYGSLGGDVDWSNLDYIKSEVPSPPYLPNIFTTAQYTTMEVEVPSESLELYKKAEGWCNFWNIKGFENTRVEDVKVDSKKEVKGRYDMNGRAVSEDYQGLVIVRFSDGSYKKMLNR